MVRHPRISGDTTDTGRERERELELQLSSSLLSLSPLSSSLSSLLFEVRSDFSLLFPPQSIHPMTTPTKVTRSKYLQLANQLCFSFWCFL